MEKNELRAAMKSRLAALTKSEYQELNRLINSSFIKLEFLKALKRIMIYYSVRNEVATIAIINYLLGLGKTVALPFCTPERDLNAAVINDLSQLQPAPFGLMEPKPGSVTLDPGKLELIVVPGVAFDEKGYRLGHGAGYYDRFLSKVPNAFKLGLAYDFQVVPEVPVAGHDQKIDGLLTPSRYLKF